jgi:UrcA family protein
MEVRLGGVDLNSDLGARVALARIRAAAKVFCGDPAEATDLGRHAATKACYSHMTYLAVNKLDAPMVTAAFKGAPLRPEIRLARR